ncbi:MAG: chlorite dismutase family protein [Chloroflexota bacterium]|nr:chlorite dismutase family protein [Chloroflexota bacterium]
MSEATAGTAPARDDVFTVWSVLRRDHAASSRSICEPGDAGVAELRGVIDQLASEGVTVRGIYDVSGMRADADVMLWLHANSGDKLQAALRALRRTALLAPLLPKWNAMGVHREAEFSREHAPAFLRGKDPSAWMCVYPFVRSYEWYILPPEERRGMLADHGKKGSAHRGVLTNTVAAFGLGDYEWLLPLEANELLDIVDVIRDLRATNARLHVRVEIPFFTGRRIPVEELPEVLA